jgi:hypothetical protein
MELWLLGYVQNASHGFALPLFGQHERTNTLYIADCRPSGDHRGAITGFQTYETDLQKWLPVARPDPVRVGDPWLDVFLWKDRVLVGDASCLWLDLAQIRDEVEIAAPLSLLDAAMHAEASDRERLAPIAYKYLSDRFDVSQADVWRMRILGREATILIRRHLPEVHSSSIGCQTSAKEPASIELPLPKAIIDLLSRKSALDPIVDNLSRFAAAFSQKFDVSEMRSTATGNEHPADGDIEDNIEPKPQTTRVLIATFGNRARTIARHIGSPVWLPAGLDADFVTSDQNRALISPKGAKSKSQSASKLMQVVDGTSRGAVSKLKSSYDVIVALVDDEYFAEESIAEIRLIVDHPALSGAVKLLVPALPEKSPAAVFNRGRSQDVLRERGFDALLDTAQARSPFWWGNAKRSLDRRIADIVSTVAALCLSESVAGRLRNLARAFQEVLALAVDLAGDLGPHHDPMLALGSEVSWADRNTPAREIYFREEADVMSRNTKAARRALLELRPLGGFEEFAKAVLDDIVGDTKSARRHFRISDSPVSLNEPLRYPDASAAFELHDDKKLLVTAEAPGIAALQKGAATNWHVVRYTDRETIKSLMRQDSGAASFLPNEVTLDPLVSNERNAAVATRGVDTRDIIRIDTAEFEEWSDALPSHERHALREEMRPLRASGADSSTITPAAVAIRRKWLTVDRPPDNRTLAALAKILRVEPRELLMDRPYRRAADLDTCWSSPTEVSMRFALADGELSPLIMRLQPEEVVLQEFFVIDGDWGVPALFRSRVFWIWATATLSRSSSWMSRFSIRDTFAGFPIPPVFKLSSSGHSNRVETDHKEIFSLSREIQQRIDRASNVRSWKAAQRSSEFYNSPDRRRLEEYILSAYQLPADADDVSILERLVEMNQRLNKN